MSLVALEDLMAERVPSVDPSKYPDEEFELLSIPAFDAGDAEHVLGSDIGSAKKAVMPNDVLLARIVPHIRRAWVVPDLTDRRQIASGEWIVFRSERFYPPYLRHVLISDPFHAEFMQTVAGVGGSLLRARPEGVKKIKIPLPPLDEQKRIAGILDQADALRRLRARALEKLNTLGQAVFQEMFGEPASNPKLFKSALLGDVINFVGGSQPAKSHFKYEDGPGLVRFVQTRDFRTDAYKTYIPKELAKRPFSEDDVIIGRYGPPVFQIFRGLSGTYNVALMKAAPKGRVTSDFIYYLLQEPKLHTYVVANSERTAGQSGVNLDLLENYPAYEPPENLQYIFSERVREITALRLNAEHSVAMAKALFASLQSAAFQGRL